MISTFSILALSLSFLSWMPVAPLPNPQYELWLKIGQSNSVGYDWSPIPSEYNQINLYAVEYKRDQSKVPLQNPNEDGGGVDMGLSFAKHRLANGAKEVMIINRGLGGSSFSANHWNKGDVLYELAKQDAVDAQTRYPKYTFKGILWHQGESDYQQSQEWYQTQLSSMVSNLRNDIPNAQNSVFIVGTLPQPWIDGYAPEAENIQSALMAVDTYIPRSSCVDLRDLTGMSDAIHYNHASQHEMGVRYGQKAKLLLN